MPESKLLQQPRVKEDPLGLCLDHLDRALAVHVPGREREWAERVINALGFLETALRRYRAGAKAPDGPLAEVDETRPTLARKADVLRNGLDDFVEQIVSLRKEVQAAADAFQPASDSAGRPSVACVADFGAIRGQAERLLTGLRANKEIETKLILESVNTDIGVGD
jgi:hypothetical protein